MLYPENISEKLGFDRIIDEITEYCQTYNGKYLAARLGFTDNFGKISKWFKQLRELSTAASEHSLPQIDPLDDITAELQLLSKEGGVLSAEELYRVASFLDTGIKWKRYIHNLDFEENEELFSLIVDLDVPDTLADDIFHIITASGEVLDHASPELKSVRRTKEALFRKTRKVVQGIFQDLKKKGFVPDDTSITVKNGRTVIPVYSEYKRQVPGYVQDESNTGQTVFIEPSGLISHLNEQQELEGKEKREIYRILRDSSERLRIHIREIRKLPLFIGIMDLLKAKYRMAQHRDYIIPVVKNNPVLRLDAAIHPILKITNDQEGKPTIPLSLYFDEKERIILISGPNAGGKSVSLKTVGLLQLMVQSGIPVPVKDGSVFGTFKSVMVDIGDDQSIDDDLSTYSSHLLNILTVIKNADERTLVLFDEFGSGTEPKVGGAIAQSTLEELCDIGCKGVITTHYHNIKELAQSRDGLVNAAMRYDSKAMEPLYVLDVGKPGQSFAIEIARKTGFSDKIIDRAKQIAGSELIELDDLLAKTEQQKRELEEKQKQIDKLHNKLEGERKRLEQKNETLDSKKKDILRKASEEAEQLLQSANREIEKTIRHIKTSKAHKGETKKVRAKLETVKKQVQEKKERVKNPKTHIIERLAEVGDRVRLEGQNGSGLVKSIKGKNAEVEFGLVTLRVKVDKLQVLEGAAEVKPSKSWVNTTNRSGFSKLSSKAHFSSELNIRGFRAEEAMMEVDKFMDAAILHGVAEIRILHGKGEGVLRDLTREVVKKYSQVESYHDEHADRGGAGITIVKLR